MFVAPRESSRGPAGHSIRRRCPRSPSGMGAVREVHAVLPSGARDRPKGAYPCGAGHRVSYNIVPRRSWLTESRVLRIPAKTEAIRSEQASVPWVSCGRSYDLAKRPCFRAGVSQNPLSLPSVISEGALARRSCPGLTPRTNSSSAKCRRAMPGLRHGRENLNAPTSFSTARATQSLPGVPRVW
jgi:hypothetical protein